MHGSDEHVANNLSSLQKASAKGVVRAVSGAARERAWWGDLARRLASQDV